MHIVGGRTVFSATDINNYLECRHLVQLERMVAEGNLRRLDRAPELELVAEKGRQHEQRYLESLRTTRDVVEIEQADYSPEEVERAAAETIAAMARGVSAIYQGTFFDGEFIGRPDFLLRVEEPSANWPWGYEVVDTKLALHDKPYFIVQLCHYSEHVTRIQGTAPRTMRVVLGNSEEKSLRVDDFAAYYRHLKRSFVESGARSDAYPFPCGHCRICDWAERCNEKRERDDHLSLVAWMRRDQIKKLEATKITTVAGLADDLAERPNGLRVATFERLRRQASLQVRGRVTGTNLYKLLDHAPATGFGMMPEPAPGDVFFDMEGDPLFEIGVGLEYLFGCYAPEDDAPFQAIWGTDRQQEKAAFERCVDFLAARRKRYPAMHVYHYAPYEKTALRKLAQRHGTREEEVDQLLRGEVLVDLYAVVRQTLVISRPSYSIKELEPFYGMTRTSGVRRGDASVVQFETWLLDPSKREILDDIKRYNEEDCRSTYLLREWLLKLREEYRVARGIDLTFKPVKVDPYAPCHPEPVEGCKSCAKRVNDEREQSKLSDDQRALCARDDDNAAVLLGNLVSYHRREEKPGWWAYFDRCENTDTLVEFDKESIGGLVLRSDIAPYRRPGEKTDIFTYEFPDQHFRFAPGDSAHDPFTRTAAGSIVRIDEDANLLELKRPAKAADAAAVTALIPTGPIDAPLQKASIANVAAAFLNGSLRSTNPVAVDLLRRAIPRFTDRRLGARIQPDHVSADAVYAVAKALDRSYLFVQGPPGSGKTHTGARIIAKLIADGKRVGVMANSHRAIHNLLHEIERYSRDCGIDLRGIHKHSARNEGSAYVSTLAKPYILSADDNTRSESGDFNLISGNSWLFARSAMIGRVDYLVIDEAGQTSLADAIAVSSSAANIVLLGDPMQLAQVSQGDHQAGAERSVLEHLLRDSSTVAEDRGILLDTSYRMAPPICAFISQAMYDGRLHADPPTANNTITSSGLSGSGLRFIPVMHEDNARESMQEAERVTAEIRRLLDGGTFTRRNESPATLSERDILVVTPYNAQRARISERLRAAGHAGIRVGTVDKFQGQEAPVVFYSMATSSAEDVPRTMEFLFERNRLNVAISRAQCMSVLVCSPKLLDFRCDRSEQIRLVNLLCRFAEMAYT